jgi:HTH-type transcriptional regulator/antitoxin MqsA
MTKNQTCPACGGTGFLSQKTREIATYKGVSDVVEFHSHVCADCGGDFSTSEDARFNKRAIVRFRKTVDFVPMGCEIRAMRERAGLTIEKAGEYFGGGPVAFSKYENDDLIPDDAMVCLLKLAISDEAIAQKIISQKSSHVHIRMYSEAATMDAAAIGSWSGGSLGFSAVNLDVVQTEQIVISRSWQN